MAYSTDAEILRVIGELNDILDHEELDSVHLSYVRVKGIIERIIDELTAIHARDGEPIATLEFRSAMPSIQIAFSSFWAAIGASENDEPQATVINNLWLAVSYLEVGLVPLLASTQENEGDALNG